MQIMRTINDPNGNGDGIPTQTITITIEPGDDPNAHLNGLVFPGHRLASFLQVYAGTGLEPKDADDAWDSLVHFGYVANMTNSRINDLMWACRDTVGLSWRKISSATERPTSTIRRTIKEWRESLASRGYWRDASGIHRGEVAEAQRWAAAQSNVSDTAGID